MNNELSSFFFLFLIQKLAIWSLKKKWLSRADNWMDFVFYFAIIVRIQKVEFHQVKLQATVVVIIIIIITIIIMEKKNENHIRFRLEMCFDNACKRVRRRLAHEKVKSNVTVLPQTCLELVELCRQN